MAASIRQGSECNRDSADSDTDSILSTTGSQYGFSNMHRTTERRISHSGITKVELVKLFKYPSKIPVEMRARKIPLGHLFQRDTIPKDVFLSLIRILTSLCNTGGEDAMNVCRFFAREGFVGVHILQYVIQLRVLDNAHNTSYETLKQIVFILKTFVQTDPGVEEATQFIAVVIQDMIGAKAAENDTKVQELLRDAKILSEPTQVAGGIRRTLRKSFRDIDIFPSPGEVVDSERAKFADLLMDDTSKLEEYLSTHFQLLRQEIVEPLRASISLYHQMKRSMSVDDIVRSPECCIFYDVKKREIITSHTTKGVAFRLQFSCGFQVSWEKTNLLAFGSLVCLTTNDFHDMIFGVVAKRDPKWLMRGSVEIRILRTEDAPKLDTNKYFLMLDSLTYIEEFLKVLNALRCTKDDGSDMAFVHHIVSLSLAGNPPKSLQQETEMKHDIGPLIKNETSTQSRTQQQLTVKISNPNDWPLPTQCDVDEYQMRAIFAMLNREVLVILGSPGTGKTYLCLKLVHLKLINKRSGEGPILFISSTRSTLDEFLLGVLQFESKDVVRSGGKTSTDLTKYGLDVYREPYKDKLLEIDRAHSAELRECSKRIDAILRTVSFVDKAILSLTEVRAFMTIEHFSSLRKEGKGAMLDWLLRGKIIPRELEYIKGQIPTIHSSGVNERYHRNDGWLEKKLLVDYHPMATRASPGLHDMVSQINASTQMPSTGVHTIRDIWQLSLPERWRLYRHWVSEFHNEAQNTTLNVYQDMDAIVKRSQSFHDNIDLTILQKASVIGMTTSEAVNARRVLKRLHASVVLVDEAADILQSITVAVLPPKSEQLVLIGEYLPKLNQHQNVKKLVKDSDVEASLIQRLRNFDYSVLKLGMQHRMSPEVSKICRNLSLTDDFKHSPSVIGCTNNFGLAQNVFFIEHTEVVSPAEYASSFLWALYNYILNAGCHADRMTVVTFPEQFKLFRGKQVKRLQTVENFRGGNDIVLFLSDGSERKSKPGCVESGSRLVTVLTSACKALYVIGNFEFLASKSELWCKVIAEARRLELVGNGLKLRCPHHAEKPKIVTTVAEFQDLQQGTGCGLPCESRLDCGHTCKLPCHEHTPDVRVTCKAKCGKTICINDHKCKNLCYQDCETVCQEPIEKKLPCGHLQNTACNLPPNEAVCQVRCERLLPCGHSCTNECSMPCLTRCVQMTTKQDWDCGHTVEVRCCDGPEICPWPCAFTLSCGHVCSGSCGKCRRGRLHAVCSQPCGRTLVCGHVCESSCPSECPPCDKPCENRCQHSKCMRKCGERCIPCQERCLWRCIHVKCPKPCGEPCERKTCDRPCKNILPCRHPCIGLCGEKCPTKCRVCDKGEVTRILFGSEDEETARFVQLEDCGHLVEFRGLDMWMGQDNVKASIQLYRCPWCKTPIRKNARYGSLINRALADIERVKQMIYGNQADIDARVNKMKQKMQTLQRQIRMGNAVSSLSDLNLLSSGSKSSHLSKVVSKVNRSSFLIQLNELFAEATQPKDGHFHQLLRPRQLWLIALLIGLKTFVCSGDVDRFTEQQIRDLQNEIYRAKMQLEACVALNKNIPWAQVGMTSNIRSVSKFFRIVDKAIPLTDNDKASLEHLMKRIRQKCGTAVLRISDSERVAIVNAVGLRKGHWYKCPRGHIYAIGECGGATENATCPECGTSIGGQSHCLAEGNAVATEMDGARHAAWPTHAHDFENPGPEFEYLGLDAADIEQQRALDIQIRILRG